MKLKKNVGIRLSDPTEELLDEDLIGRAIWECLKEGDSVGVMEIIAAYVEALDKTEMAKKTSIARSAKHHALKSKNKNPTIKTLAKLVHGCV